jgi:hypothetical protein
MVATADQIQAVIDPDGSDLELNLVRMVPTSDPAFNDCYVVGGVPPYAGKSRWCRVTTAGNAAAQGAEIIAQMAA